MLTSVHTLYQSLVRLLLTEECFLMSTQKPTCWLCKETLLLSSTSLKGLRTQPRKYVVTADSNIFLRCPSDSAICGAVGQPCNMSFSFWPQRPGFESFQGCVFMASSSFESNWTKIGKSLLTLVNFDVDLNLWIEKNYL